MMKKKIKCHFYFPFLVKRNLVKVKLRVVQPILIDFDMTNLQVKYFLSIWIYIRNDIIGEKNLRRFFFITKKFEELDSSI